MQEGIHSGVSGEVHVLCQEEHKWLAERLKTSPLPQVVVRKSFFAQRNDALREYYFSSLSGNICPGNVVAPLLFLPIDPDAEPGDRFDWERDREKNIIYYPYAKGQSAADWDPFLSGQEGTDAIVRFLHQTSVTMESLLRRGGIVHGDACLYNLFIENDGNPHLIDFAMASFHFMQPCRKVERSSHGFYSAPEDSYSNDWTKHRALLREICLHPDKADVWSIAYLALSSLVGHHILCKDRNIDQDFAFLGGSVSQTFDSVKNFVCFALNRNEKLQVEPSQEQKGKQEEERQVGLEQEKEQEKEAKEVKQDASSFDEHFQQLHNFLQAQTPSQKQREIAKLRKELTQLMEESAATKEKSLFYLKELWQGESETRTLSPRHLSLVHLLSNMMTMWPQDRYTWRQVLGHPLFHPLSVPAISVLVDESKLELPSLFSSHPMELLIQVTQSAKHREFVQTIISTSSPNVFPLAVWLGAMNLYIHYLCLELKQETEMKGPIHILPAPSAGESRAMMTILLTMVSEILIPNYSPQDESKHLPSSAQRGIVSRIIKTCGAQLIFQPLYMGQLSPSTIFSTPITDQSFEQMLELYLSGAISIRSYAKLL